MSITGLESKIDTALMARLASLTLSPVRRVAWPGADFTPGSGEIYLEPNVIPNTTTQASLGYDGVNRHQGLFQISVWSPLATSTIPALEVASAVMAHFKRGTVLTFEGITLRINQPPSRAPALTDGAWRQIPVTIPYFTDNPNP